MRSSKLIELGHKIREGNLVVDAWTLKQKEVPSERNGDSMASLQSNTMEPPISSRKEKVDDTYDLQQE